MNKTALAQGIALALALGAASSADAATTMYNTYNAFSVATASDGNGTTGQQTMGTDGWVYGKNVAYQANSTTPSFVGINGSATPSSSTPFGYAASAPVNWAVELSSDTDSGTVSQADSFARYGVYANIDTAKGAWSDNAVSGAGGWRHNADFGLFRSQVETDVHLRIDGVLQSGTNFGFTIFKGMDTNQATAYGHHGSWNAGNNASGVTSSSLIAGGTTFTTADIVAYSVGGAATSNLNDITFRAEANQVYTIVLGGYRNGKWNDTADGYTLSVAAVPIPAAAWLFGSAMAGLGVFGRRKGEAEALT